MPTKGHLISEPTTNPSLRRPRIVISLLIYYAGTCCGWRPRLVCDDAPSMNLNAHSGQLVPTTVQW